MDWLKSSAVVGGMLVFWSIAGSRVRTAIRRHIELFHCDICGFETLLLGYMTMHNIKHIAETLHFHAKKV